MDFIRKILSVFDKGQPRPRKKRKRGNKSLPFPAQQSNAHPQAVPYTPAVDKALSPVVTVLEALMTNPEDVDTNQVPAKQYLVENKKPLTAVLNFTAGLSRLELGQIYNWFEVHIAKNDHKLRRLWMTGLAAAHAHTVYIAVRDSPSSEGEPSRELLKAAWDTLKSLEYVNRIVVDIDREAVLALEELMFERSHTVGVAGHFQWGLDAGDHEERWDPYWGLPVHWNHEDRSDSESELQTGPNFIEIVPPPLPKPKAKEGPRTKPKPIVRATVT